MDNNGQGDASAYPWHPQGDGTEGESNTQWACVNDSEEAPDWTYHSNSASYSGVPAGIGHAYFPGTGTQSPYSMPPVHNRVAAEYSQSPHGYGTHVEEMNLSRDRRQMIGPQRPEPHRPGSYGLQAHEIVETTEPYVPPSSFPSEHSYPPQYNAHHAAASMSYSPSTSQMNKHSPEPNTVRSGTEYSVACPYRCGAILTGVHAVGNLNRHLKTQACVASGRAKSRHPCPIETCTKEYSRSDGLKVHMRRQHGASAAVPKNGSPFGVDIEEDDVDDDEEEEEEDEEEWQL